MQDCADVLVPVADKPNTLLSDIEEAHARLAERFERKIVVEPALSRSLVSFQANKERPFYRWYKFKEAFSASLVEYLLHRFGVRNGAMLDPFAGSGTALFAASAVGLNADGIELLPVGQRLIETRKAVSAGLTVDELGRLRQWVASGAWNHSTVESDVPELRITKGAYSEATKRAIGRYLGACQSESGRVQAILGFALLCVLEEVSYTRKDGQYLRWDYRSGRCWGKKVFDKGSIPDFDLAISAKINDILADLSPANRDGLFLFDEPKGEVRLFEGSCLDVLPQSDGSVYDAVITSPPYCNRYDYTRTYALELALLNTDEKGLSRLRQQMLSCTVENREKDLLAMNPGWKETLSLAENQGLLQAILRYLDTRKSEGALNNTGIPRMVRGYFYEMACVIAECARVLKPDAPLFMVNDNVRYAGVSVPVDMILSDFAEKLGFSVESILVLPNGKGNSSQQMGEHGREALRKCVYVWRRLQ